MRKLALVIGLAAAFFIMPGGCSKSKKKPIFPPDPTNPQVQADAEAEFLALLNTERAAASAPPLTIDSKMNRAADAYAKWFAHYWSDEGMFPYAEDRDGKTAAQRLNEKFVVYTTNAETGYLAMDTVSAADALAGMKVTHLNELMNPSFTMIGIGAVMFM